MHSRRGEGHLQVQHLKLVLHVPTAVDGKIVGHQQHWILRPLLPHLLEKDPEFVLVDRSGEGLEVLYAILHGSSDYDCSWFSIQLLHVHQDVGVGE